ncbi:preprotein translocase subunit SecE [bacterium]|jgi:preprotein translocase subunit SecE|nr:preprotein translocase subunit SecE [bacterium]MBT4249952.1 preprotein translocase subunit SecE [bacterium]MDC0911096.1 preprotein translocase subunit SecE [Candidatus Neomarinimicrobiota bacterium]
MIKKVQQFGVDVKYEMSKVSWPDWDSLRGSTYVVLVLSLILTVFLFIVDLFLSKSISTIM